MNEAQAVERAQPVVQLSNPLESSSAEAGLQNEPGIAVPIARNIEVDPVRRGATGVGNATLNSTVGSIGGLCAVTSLHYNSGHNLVSHQEDPLPSSSGMYLSVPDTGYRATIDAGEGWWGNVYVTAAYHAINVTWQSSRSRPNCSAFGVNLASHEAWLTVGTKRCQAFTTNIYEVHHQLIAVAKGSVFQRTVDPTSIPRSISTPWFEAIKVALREYESLPIDWDGEGGIPARKTAVDDALGFLKNLPTRFVPPHPMLMNAGEVGLYWRRNSVYATLSFSGDGTLSYYAESVSSPIQDDQIPIRDSAKLARLLEMLEVASH